MTKPFYLGAYWGRRPETAAACAQRLADLLKRFADIDTQLGTWYEQGNSAAPDPALRIEPTVVALTGLLESAQHRNDWGRPIPELGYLVGAWNGRDPGMSLSITCGANPATDNIRNAVALTLPAAEDAPELYTRRAALDLLTAVVEAWAPDWATLTSHPLRRAQGAAGGDIVFGWATWRTGHDPDSALRLPASVAQLPIGHGTAVVLPDAPRPDVPADMVIAVRALIAPH